MTSETSKLIKDLPTTLSGDQVRKFLHISKRKCAWLLQNGHIKCKIDSKKQSRKYTVNRTDLGNFIDDSKAHPEKYQAPFAAFSAAKYNPNPPIQTARYGFPKTLPESFAPWLDDELANVPDALTIDDIINITGYSDTAVDRWLHNGYLRSVLTQNGKIIAKDWLIDFYSGYGYTITKMSEKHIKLMVKYFNQQ